MKNKLGDKEATFKKEQSTIDNLFVIKLETGEEVFNASVVSSIPFDRWKKIRAARLK